MLSAASILHSWKELQMIYKYSLAMLFGLSLLFACNGDEPPTAPNNLPQLPQILPNTQSGVIAFGLTTLAASDQVEVVFLNGGKDPLVIKDYRLEGRDAAEFTVISVLPDNLTAPTREAISIQVQFTSPGRGVYLARLVVESNAANSPLLDLELVGPGANTQPLDQPDIELFETVVTIAATESATVPTALVRYYNLGTQTLVFNSYDLVDTTNFAFLDGTALPGSTCDVAGKCIPTGTETKGCCAGLSCVSSVCDVVRLVSGQFAVFGVAFAEPPPASGSYSTTLTLNSNDPDSAQSVVTIEGVL